MFTPLRDVVPGGADVLVVGSGPAGLAVAEACADGGATVLVAESGGPRAQDDALNDIETSGLPFPGARAGRTRGFGGTGEKWAGQCRPLDPLDLQPRYWVDGSGWPLDADELAPWYARASAWFALEGATYSPSDVVKTPVELPAVGTPDLEWRILRYSPAHRAGSERRSALAGSRTTTVVTGATVTGLLRDGDRVTGVRVSAPDGTSRELQARETVLAGGALENARLLLLAGEDGAAVPGNEGGWVGRGLQDHPHWLVGELLNADPRIGVAFQSVGAPGGRARAKLALSEAAQARAGSLNGVLDVDLLHGPGSAVGAAKRLWDAYSQRRRPEAPVRDALRVVGAPGALAAEVRARRRGTGSPPDGHTRLGLRVQTEQPPIGESAVTLGGTRDRYGSRLPRVHWTVGEAEQRTCRAVAEAARAAFEGAGLGRVVLEPWLDDLDAVRRRAEDFYHHAGTTRMAASASDGVVDVHGAVHGTTGLHVAGASVFPTSGYANPTLTIVALALRLGHHLTC